jgi:hypothetical protein
MKAFKFDGVRIFDTYQGCSQHSRLLEIEFNRNTVNTRSRKKKASTTDLCGRLRVGETAVTPSRDRDARRRSRQWPRRAQSPAAPAAGQLELDKARPGFRA